MHRSRFPGQGTRSVYRHKPSTGVGDMLTVDDVAPSVIDIVIVISLITPFDGCTNELHHTFRELIAYWPGVSVVVIFVRHTTDHAENDYVAHQLRRMFRRYRAVSCCQCHMTSRPCS